MTLVVDARPADSGLRSCCKIIYFRHLTALRRAKIAPPADRDNASRDAKPPSLVLTGYLS